MILYFLRFVAFLVGYIMLEFIDRQNLALVKMSLPVSPNLLVVAGKICVDSLYAFA